MKGPTSTGMGGLDASVSEDERTEEQYLEMVLLETALRFDVTCEFGSSGLWE
jgi:hypothetical protein